MRTTLAAVAAVAAFAIASHDVRTRAADTNATLTAVPGVKVGHFTLAERPTGCTVVLVEAGVTAGVDVRGAAPATAETDLLKPINLVQQIHAVVLSGGSAFGLDSRSGVMRYLDEKNVGFKAFGNVNVPIVPAASLIDLNVGGSSKIRPTADCGYKAAQAATTAPVAEGNVGAGAGATLGKVAGRERAMKGGLGSAAIRMIDDAVRYPRWLRLAFSRSCASLRWASDISLINRPYRGHRPCAVPVGMKCQRIRSSLSNANDAFCRCSGVRLATNFVAADWMDDADRSALTSEPAAPATAKTTASQNRADLTMRMCPPVRVRTAEF